MKTTAFAVLALAASASAFAPTVTTRQSTALNAEKNAMNVDDNFDDVNLVGLMGLKRLKKVARRHKRELNERVRNFAVVQDGEGEWVAATAEQTAEMKAAASGDN